MFFAKRLKEAPNFIFSIIHFALLLLVMCQERMFSDSTECSELGSSLHVQIPSTVSKLNRHGVSMATVRRWSHDRAHTKLKQCVLDHCADHPIGQHLQFSQSESAGAKASGVRWGQQYTNTCVTGYWKSDQGDAGLHTQTLPKICGGNDTKHNRNCNNDRELEQKKEAENRDKVWAEDLNLLCYSMSCQ